VKEQIIQLEPHDDVISARDKLGWVRAPRVLLILPDDPTQPILQRKLDLLILQREATRKRSQLAIITRDPIILNTPANLASPVFVLLSQAENVTGARNERASAWTAMNSLSH